MTEQLDALVAAWADAEAKADGDALDAMLTDDFVGIGPVGFMLPKPVWLTRCALGLHYEDLHLEEVSVRRYGDAAVIVARQRAIGEAQGNEVPDDTRVSLVVTKDASSGDWRIAGIQYSFIAPMPS